MNSTLSALKVLTYLLIAFEAFWVLNGTLQTVGFGLYSLLGDTGYGGLMSVVHLVQIGFYVLLLKLLRDLTQDSHARSDDQGE